MKLKLGRHEYQISGDDIFMDNGACIQLLTQSKLPGWFDSRPNPKLTKGAIKQISRYPQVDIENKEGIRIFRLLLQEVEK